MTTKITSVNIDTTTITQVGNLTSLSMSGNIVPTSNVTYNLGSPTMRFKDLYLSGNTIDLAGAKISVDTTSGSIALTPAATVANPSPTPTKVVSTKTLTMVQSGAITTPFTGVARCYPTANITIQNVYASLGTPSSGNLSFALLKNNTSVGTYSFSANSYRMTTTSANISVSTTDYLTINVTSGAGATDLKVDLEYVLQ